MARWRNIFDKGRKRETVDSLRSKIERFRTCWTRTTCVLEPMAEAGESLGGDLLFDFQYLRRLAAQLEDSAQRVVLDLNFITDNRYLALAEAFERVQARVADVLQSRPSVPDTPYALPLDEIDRDLGDAAGEKMARLGEIRKRLKYKVPDGFVITSRACLRLFEKIGLADHLRRAARTEAEDEPGPRCARRDREPGWASLILDAPHSRATSPGRSTRRSGRPAKGGKAPGPVRRSLQRRGRRRRPELRGSARDLPGSAAVRRCWRATSGSLASLFTAPAVVYRTEHAGAAGAGPDGRGVHAHGPGAVQRRRLHAGPQRSRSATC